MQQLPVLAALLMQVLDHLHRLHDTFNLLIALRGYLSGSANASLETRASKATVRSRQYIKVQGVRKGDAIDQCSLAFLMVCYLVVLLIVHEHLWGDHAIDLQEGRGGCRLDGGRHVHGGASWHWHARRGHSGRSGQHLTCRPPAPHNPFSSLIDNADDAERQGGTARAVCQQQRHGPEGALCSNHRMTEAY